MAKRDSFLLRMNPRILSAIRKWSDDELRSVNAQIEFLLNEALKKNGRLPAESSPESLSHATNPSNGSKPKKDDQ